MGDTRLSLRPTPSPLGRAERNILSYLAEHDGKWIPGTHLPDGRGRAGKASGKRLIDRRKALAGHG